MEYKKILHGLDGSEGPFKALEQGVELQCHVPVGHAEALNDLA